jgi:hypothetical protein
MDSKLLKKHVQSFLAKSKSNELKFIEDKKERQEQLNYYQSFNSKKILTMNNDDVYEYISKLWAMLIWGNKYYVVNKIIEDNTLEKFRSQLNNLLWGKEKIEKRWDTFRKEIKGMGPAMMSEILCKTHPEHFMLWNRKAYIGLKSLEANQLPKNDYQITGKVYVSLCNICKLISQELEKNNLDNDMLAVDYFIWDELQLEDKKLTPESEVQMTKDPDPKASDFIHDDIRDKLANIGDWLGFKSNIEQKVALGSVVDTIWEATIGNMGRIIYVFEVQTKGSIDSLILNLLKALNNPAVQGVVAVSDSKQLEKIRAHASDVQGLKDKLKYWDYEEILRVHNSLEFINGTINKLDLVPQGF